MHLEGKFHCSVLRKKGVTHTHTQSDFSDIKVCKYISEIDNSLLSTLETSPRP